MEIRLDQWNCCTSKKCIYERECSRHESAGDFRSESSFIPDIKEEPMFNRVVCLTADLEPDPDFEYQTIPLAWRK